MPLPYPYVVMAVYMSAVLFVEQHQIFEGPQCRQLHFLAREKCLVESFCCLFYLLLQVIPLEVDKYCLASQRLSIVVYAAFSFSYRSSYLLPFIVLQKREPYIFSHSNKVVILILLLVDDLAKVLVIIHLLGQSIKVFGLDRAGNNVRVDLAGMSLAVVLLVNLLPLHNSPIVPHEILPIPQPLRTQHKTHIPSL